MPDFDKAIERLNVLYSKIPDTVGCSKHISAPKEENGCGGWCCKYQCPSVLYVEFKNAWRDIIRTWSADQIVDLVEKALRNYLSQFATKGCILWDGETKLCRIHKTRFYNCRIYGITPAEEFKPRYERLKVLYKDDPTTVIRDQCNLIKTADGSPVTIKDTTQWWLELVDIEMSIGIEKENINDGPGGSYRTFHDHILLNTCSDKMMRQLGAIRLNGTTVEREIAIKGIIEGFRKKLKKLLKENDEETNQDS